MNQTNVAFLLLFHRSHDTTHGRVGKHVTCSIDVTLAHETKHYLQLIFYVKHRGKINKLLSAHTSGCYHNKLLIDATFNLYPLAMTNTKTYTRPEF
jgi:hypothetical protein